MLVVLGKDDCLSEFFAVIDAQTVLHQDMEHLTNGILVKHPFVDSRGSDAFGEIAVFILKGVLVSLSIFFGKIVVHYSLLNKFQFAFNRHKIHKKSIGNRLRKLVGIGRYVGFEFKYIIGILVDFVFRRGGKTNQGSVEIIENILVFVVDGAVCLVHDHEIEMSNREEFLFILVLNSINTVHHRLIGREYTTRVKVFFVLAEIGYREVMKHIHKGTLCLCNERVSVSQEQNILHPAVIK